MSKSKSPQVPLKTNIRPEAIDELKKFVSIFAAAIVAEGGDLRALHRELGDVIFSHKKSAPTEAREERPSIPPPPPPSRPRLAGPRLAKATLNKKQVAAGFSHRKSA